MGRLESEVRPENPHYFWLEPSSRGDVDMIAKRYPGVRLLHDEELLPINKLSAVWVETVDTVIGMIVRLYLFWGVEEREVWVRGVCGFDDDRLKRQLASLPEFSKLFRQWRNSADLSKETIKAYEVGEQISESELPEFIRPYVFQAKVWGDAVSELWSNFLYSYDSEITREGYYLASVKPSSFLLGRTQEQHEEQEGIDRNIKLFDFDPQTQPPEIGPQGIHWVLEDKKLILALPHLAARPMVVDYYGYRDTWLKFLSEQRPERLIP